MFFKSYTYSLEQHQLPRKKTLTVCDFTILRRINTATIESTIESTIYTHSTNKYRKQKKLELLFRKTGCSRTPAPPATKKKKEKIHAVTNSLHSLSTTIPSPIHPTYKTHFLNFLIARQKSKKNLITPGVTQGNLELTLTSLNKRKHVISACPKYDFLPNPITSHLTIIEAPQKGK